VTDVDPDDRAAVAAQLGRDPRAIRAVAHRCPCGNPDVVETSRGCSAAHPPLHQL